MQKYERFHILYSVKYIKYALILCVVPMLRALLAWDLASLLSALRQDAVILALMLMLAFVFWYCAGYKASDDSICSRSGLVCPVTTVIPYSSIAALEITRSLTLRLLCASRLTLYFKANYTMRTRSFYLPRKAAAALANRIFPVKTEHSVFAPAGANRLVFAMLSANVATSTYFIFTFAHRLDEILGLSSADFAITRLEQLSALILPFLPAGLSLLAALLFTLFAFGLLLSLLHTAGFVVCRNNGVLISRGGLITLIERRFCCAAINACDVRVTLVARLLHRYPVFLYAGSYMGKDAPAFAFAQCERAALYRLLPELEWHKPAYKAPAARSIMQFIWLPLSVTAVLGAIFTVAFLQMPSLCSILFLPIMLSLATLALAFEGYGREGIALTANRTLAISYTRLFTRHDLCVLTQDVSMLLWQHPMAAAEGRCDAYLYLPCHKKVRVRGLQAHYIKTLILPQ